jgi:molybdenum cofactor cytidylyltransferase
MGRCKPLLPLGDHLAIVRLIQAIRVGGVAHVAVVVAPPHGDAVAAAVAPLGVSLVRNDDPESDMAGSARAALAAAGPGPDAFLLCPADHPLVSPATFAAMAAAHADGPGRIVVPVHAGRNGHPTLFPREALAELSSIPTLRDVVRRDPGRVLRLPVPDPGVLADLDTPADYERALARLSRSR